MTLRKADALAKENAKLAILSVLEKARFPLLAREIQQDPLIRELGLTPHSIARSLGLLKKIGMVSSQNWYIRGRGRGDNNLVSIWMRTGQRWSEALRRQKDEKITGVARFHQQVLSLLESSGPLTASELRERLAPEWTLAKTGHILRKLRLKGKINRVRRGNNRVRKLELKTKGLHERRGINVADREWQRYYCMPRHERKQIPPPSSVQEAMEWRG